MSKRSDSFEVIDDAELDEPGSRLRARTSEDDRFVEELHARWKAGELTADDVVERIQELTLSRAREELSDSDFRAFEHHMRQNFSAQHLEKLRR